MLLKGCTQFTCFFLLYSLFIVLTFFLHVTFSFCCSYKKKLIILISAAMFSRCPIRKKSKTSFSLNRSFRLSPVTLRKTFRHDVGAWPSSSRRPRPHAQPITVSNSRLDIFRLQSQGTSSPPMTGGREETPVVRGNINKGTMGRNRSLDSREDAPGAPFFPRRAVT